MGKHLRALLIVIGISILGGAAALVYKSSKEEASLNEKAKAAIGINQVLPDFESKDIQGRLTRLSQYQGKIVILNFWASWCAPCVEEMPSLIKLVKAFPQDVVLLAISGDSTMEDIESFLKSFPELKTLPNIQVIFDENKRLSQQYQIYRLPESFILNQDRVMVKKISGIIDWHNDDALEYMKSLIKPKAE